MKVKLGFYCQYLLSSQINYTGTYLADHVSGLAHDSVYRFLKDSTVTPRTLWDQVSSDIIQIPDGCIVFDDTVLSKIHSNCIEGVRRQYSGNAKKVIKGIGVVTCVYVNPHTEQYWVIDYRLFDPDRDGKSKVDHVLDMMRSLRQRQVQYSTVLMDSWYATLKIMMTIINDQKIFYCPLKSNRLVDDSQGQRPYQPLKDLAWSPDELAHGKILKVKKFSKNTRFKAFRVQISTNRTDIIVTNDMTQASTEDIRTKNTQRWFVERSYREAKQLTGIEQCQCRINRSQRNHIGAALLVWARLRFIADQMDTTLYQLKQIMVHDYLVKQLQNPTLKFI